MACVAFFFDFDTRVGAAIYDVFLFSFMRDEWDCFGRGRPGDTDG